MDKYDRTVNNAIRRANRPRLAEHERFTQPFARSGIHTELARTIRTEPKGYFLCHCEHHKLLILPCVSCGRTQGDAATNMPMFSTGEWHRMRAKF